MDHSQITPMNGANVIIRLIAQYGRRYKLKCGYYQFLCSVWNLKVKLLKTPLNSGRESYRATFANTCSIYGSYLYSPFDQV